MSTPVTTQPAPRVLKAYTAREDGEGHAVVVFAASGVEARRLGASKLAVSFEDVESCTRSPQFDTHASAGKVPPLVLIAHGWWFECDCCGHKITSDYEGPEGEELEPVVDGDRVYCNTAHLMAEWRRKRALEDRMNAVVEACWLKFYGLPISNLRGAEHYQVGGRETVTCCDFDFPGRKGLHARWDLGAPHVYISQCDEQAWQATVDAGRRNVGSGRHQAE